MHCNYRVSAHSDHIDVWAEPAPAIVCLHGIPGTLISDRAPTRLHNAYVPTTIPRKHATMSTVDSSRCSDGGKRWTTFRPSMWLSTFPNVMSACNAVTTPNGAIHKANW